jgi:Ras-related protein Rab-2A
MVGKVIIIGDSGVGKTTILTQFVHERYNNQHDLTIGVDFGTKCLNINGVDIKLQIWDTAGQEAFRSISRSYYKGAKVAIIVFDVRSVNYFNKVNSWIDDLQLHNDNVKIIIVGNKKDMLSIQQNSMLLNNMKTFKYQSYLISSKNYSDVEKIFINAAEFIYESQKDELQTKHNEDLQIVSTASSFLSNIKQCWG